MERRVGTDESARERSVAARLVGVRRTLLDPFVTALALATAAGLLLEPFRPGSALHPHWLGEGPVSGTLAALFAVTILGRAPMETRWGPRARWGSLALTTATFLLAAAGAARHARAVAEGRVVEDGSLPNACLLAAILVGASTLTGVAPVEARTGSWRRVARWTAVGIASAVLVLAWIGAAGAVNYGAGRTADAILVFGSRVYADGRPSGSLTDRTTTACALWKRGAAPVIVLSGGRGPDAPISEPEAMRAIALAEGVPESALVLDEQGLTTEASIENTRALACDRSWHRVLAVSHDYHLARIRLLGDRAGLAIRTVPATETVSPAWKVRPVAREVLAWAAAWLL